MADDRQTAIESRDLQERLERLDQTYRATLNILDDFDQEKEKLTRVQQAALNVLEDFDEERERYRQIQGATLNLLEDLNEERNRLRETQGALMNIVEDAEVERERTERARTLLEAANKELEAFSYSVSHDLRAPLRAIDGFAEAVIEDYAPRLDDEGRRYLGLIIKNARDMGQLVDDLLAFSRLGRQAITKTEIDMAALAAEVFEELIGQVPERKVEFAIRPVPLAHGDPRMVQQVLVNLLANAVKFTRARQVAAVEFGYSAQPDGGAYYVKDNGVGFDMRYYDKLFGVFQRLHAVTEFEGTGVGLALVHRIVTRHGGRVWGQSVVGQGASFYFTLPEEPAK